MSNANGGFVSVLLTHLFDVKYYRDLEMSLKVIESGTIWKLRYGFLFAFYSIVTMAVSVAIFEIFIVKERPDLKI